MSRDGAAGFTLIELMVVVVVIAILGAVAYPSYTDHIRKAKRAEGRGALLKAAQTLERYYSDRSTYVADLAPLFGLAPNSIVYSGENPGDIKGAYRITFTAPDAACPINACFIVTATPNTPFVDPQCGNLTLNSVGTRGTNSGSASGTDTCRW